MVGQGFGPIQGSNPHVARGDCGILLGSFSKLRPCETGTTMAQNALGAGRNRNQSLYCGLELDLQALFTGTATRRSRGFC